MKIIGCDLHAAQQTIAMVDRETGEVNKKILKHEGESVREFYGSLPAPVYRDYTLRILPRANHMVLEAKVGNNAETRSSQRFVPVYLAIVLTWLSAPVKGLVVAK